MGGMGGMGGRRGGMGGPGMGGQRSGMPKFATAKELERFNAAEAVLNDRKKLKLTDQQVEQLTALRATLYEKNADLLVRYDSVRRNFNPPKALTDARGPVDEGSMPSQEELAKLREQMLAMSAIGEQMMQRRPDNMDACLALVDETQKDRARKVLDDQTDDMKKALPLLQSRDGRGGRR
jgi:hypothetical protein